MTEARSARKRAVEVYKDRLGGNTGSLKRGL